jgi:hypothetical protein
VSVDSVLNQIALDCPSAWIGLIAAGGLLRPPAALLVLGLTEQDLRAHGVRILMLGMIWSLEPDRVLRGAPLDIFGLRRPGYNGQT